MRSAAPSAFWRKGRSHRTLLRQLRPVRDIEPELPIRLMLSGVRIAYWAIRIFQRPRPKTPRFAEIAKLLTLEVKTLRRLTERGRL
jgi:hypothetical protein